jgi:hypothetical protein
VGGITKQSQRIKSSFWNDNISRYIEEGDPKGSRFRREPEASALWHPHASCGGVITPFSIRERLRGGQSTALAGGLLRTRLHTPASYSEFGLDANPSRGYTPSNQFTIGLQIGIAFRPKAIALTVRESNGEAMVLQRDSI